MNRFTAAEARGSCPAARMRRGCIAVPLLLASCAVAPPAALDERALLDELRATPFEPPDSGLDPDHAVALALARHPDLIALRGRLEVATNAVAEASAWRNPEFRPSLGNLVSTVGGPLSFAFGFRCFLPAPGEIDAKTAQAQAFCDQVAAEVAAREAAIVAQTRIAHASVVRFEEELRLAEHARSFQARIAELITARVAAQAATGFDEALAMLRGVELADELVVLQERLDVARTDLASGVVAAPGAAIHVKRGARRNGALLPAATASEEGALEEAALSRRPDLRALRHRYDGQQQALARIERGLWPLFLQPELEGDHDGHSAGLRAGFEIPLFDDGDALLRVEEARAREARDAYIAKLHVVRREIHVARLDREQAHRRQQHQQERVLPLLERAEVQLRAALDAGEQDALDLLAFEARLLDARRAMAGARFEFERALVGYELATGVVFEGA